jgi:hypothetical protein
MTRRRGNGEDSVYKDGDRWRGAVSLGYDANGHRVRKQVSGRTRAETVEKLRKLCQQADTGIVPDDHLTVGAFLDRWLSVNIPGTLAESTEDDYNDTVRLHLRPALSNKWLTRLTVVDLDKLWKTKREAGYSANSVRIMRTVLRRALGRSTEAAAPAPGVPGLPQADRADLPRRPRRRRGTRRPASGDGQLRRAQAPQREDLAGSGSRVLPGRASQLKLDDVQEAFMLGNTWHPATRHIRLRRRWTMMESSGRSRRANGRANGGAARYPLQRLLA